MKPSIVTTAERYLPPYKYCSLKWNVPGNITSSMKYCWVHNLNCISFLIINWPKIAQAATQWIDVTLDMNTTVFLMSKKIVNLGDHFFHGYYFMFPLLSTSVIDRSTNYTTIPYFKSPKPKINLKIEKRKKQTKQERKALDIKRKIAFTIAPISPICINFWLFLNSKTASTSPVQDLTLTQAAHQLRTSSTHDIGMVCISKKSTLIF